MSRTKPKSAQHLKMAALCLAGFVLGGQGNAQDIARQVADRPPLNFYGVTGIIDLPSAQSQPDGQLSLTVANFGGTTRTTLTFQILPRLEGSFRYTKFGGLNFVGFEDYFDRSFDLSLRIFDETRFLPAIKIGLQDFIGTGLSSAEYIVATKTFGDRLTLTGGLGWGRLASDNALGTPFGARPALVIGTGGTANVDQWFRGPVAPFAGIAWRATDKLTLLAEYSSDGYLIESGRGAQGSTAILDRKSPLNFGLNYKYNSVVSLGAHYMYGSTFGLNINLSLNPYNPAVRGSTAPAPQPVALRPDRRQSPAAWAEEWAVGGAANAPLLASLHGLLDPQGINVDSLSASADAVTVRVRSSRFDNGPQMLGRVMRAMTAVMPASVETFRIVPVVSGLATSTVTVRRSDVEAVEHAPDGTAQLLAVTGFGPGPGRADAAAALNTEIFPKFLWSLGPYLRQSFFDPQNPALLELGARLSASYEPTPGFILSGSVTKRAVGNIHTSVRTPSSALPGVRTDGAFYDREGDPTLETLTAAYYFRPAQNLYGRVTGGYLERMFGGISGEVLWRPVTSRLALGAELNYVRQRAFDGGFGFRDYDVVTGHVSAYYQMQNGFHAQLDVGRYLAGDLGATLSIDREFRNGWKVGAFATLTDVSAADFGEGSFDKGIRLEIPVSWFLGTPNTYKTTTTLRPITRDGGARLNVAGRLYEQVRQYHRPTLENSWGRVLQ